MMHELQGGNLDVLGVAPPNMPCPTAVADPLPSVRDDLPTDKSVVELCPVGHVGRG